MENILKYFEKQRLPFLDSWNMYGVDGSLKKIRNLTNNAIEVYNFRFNNLF